MKIFCSISSSALGGGVAVVDGNDYSMGQVAGAKATPACLSHPEK